MTLNIVALFVYIFGAYAYGYLVVLWLRARTSAWAPEDAPEPVRAYSSRISIAMFATSFVWFVLHATIAFRALMGDPPENDLIDLATLEIVFLFPGLIFHAYLLEARSERRPFDRAGAWRLLSWALYVAGAGLAIYFTAGIFDFFTRPAGFGRHIGWSIGALYAVMSVSCVIVMSAARRGTNVQEERLRSAVNVLFAAMIVAFLVGIVGRGGELLLGIVAIGVRAAPLLFLLVSVYFENRIEFYDLVVKRGVLLMVSLTATGGVLWATLDWADRMPEGARPWMFAVLLLPVALLMPWLHDRLGRLLDRLWFGRDFVPVEAVKHVQAAMQNAADEASLIAGTEAGLRDIFRRPVAILREDESAPPGAREIVTIRTPADTQVRFAVLKGQNVRTLLSEDVALLRSLGGVFGYMLENVRLHRRRREQEQLAHDLRLQTSRSELKALRAQINPHFLFNALNAIASLIHTDPARADAAVEQLAEVFRYTLRRSEQEWAPLDQELAFARAYLDVEQARFGKRLEYAIGAEPSVARAQVPAMLLQTLVENAVKHGISRLRRPGRIDVLARREDGRLRLEVRDNGPGLDARPDRDGTGESFGLRSVRDRLRGHFGDGAQLNLRREGDLTVATLDIPLIEELSPVAGGMA